MSWWEKLYNKINIRRWARFEILAEILNKKKHTIQIYFSRNNLDIEDPNHIRKYIQENMKIKIV